MNTRKLVKQGLLVLLAGWMLVSLAACGAAADGGVLKASGTISATKVSIASELSGKVKEVLVKEGDSVKTGDVLFRLDDELAQAQKRQTEAAVNRAQSGLELAQSQQKAAKAQFDLAESQSRLQTRDARRAEWKVEQPDAIKLPSWYYQKSEEINAAAAELTDAQKSLEAEKASLDQVLKKNSGSKFVELEKNLAQAQAAYRVAKDAFDLANDAKKNEELKKVGQDALDKAKADLESLQKEYDRGITSSAADEILQARARLALAQARYDQAVERHSLLLTGDDALQVNVAAAGLQQAKAGVASAEAALAEAQAGLKTLDLQLAKTATQSPANGVVLSRSLEAGEMIGAGSVVMTVGRLDEVTVTVYVSETQYGRITLGQTAEVSADSFPGKVFSGKVTYIADQAEFTPRNVQTVDGRRTTVYGIKITIPNPARELKPGMPADVEFKTTK